VPHGEMCAFVSAVAQAAGLPGEKATRLAEMLVGNDLREVFSHGTRQVATYARLMDDGTLNADPDVEVVRETPVSVLVDGDGGLGYFPAEEGTRRAVEKADERGLAAMATRNHGHFGAAGLYARRAVERDLLAFVTSGHQLDLEPGEPVYDAAGGSPMAFCAPADEEDPLVLDFGTMHDLYANSPHRDAIAELAPGLVLRSIGLGTVCQTWGGLLAGLAVDEPNDFRNTQGSLALVFRVDLFADPDRFKREVDEYARAVRELEPLDAVERARLPGGPEAENERENREEGIPVGPDHREELESAGEEFGVDVPWA